MTGKLEDWEFFLMPAVRHFQKLKVCPQVDKLASGGQFFQTHVLRSGATVGLCVDGLEKRKAGSPEINAPSKAGA